jgi:apoptosis-inducing factor 3
LLDAGVLVPEIKGAAKMAAGQDDKLPDLTRGIRLKALASGKHLKGCVGKDKVLLWRDNPNVYAFEAECPHLGGPLDEGLIQDGAIRCPWHHATFDLRTGDAIAPPAFDALTRYSVQIDDGLVLVGKPVASTQAVHSARPGNDIQGPMVIIGGGAAGFAAAHALRKAGWAGEISLLSADEDVPYDRTLLTKDYLDGHFGDDRLPIARCTLESIGVQMALDTSVEAIDVDGKVLRLRGGGAQPYGKLLLAIGAEPLTPAFPGVDLPHVHCLRSLADCRRIRKAIETSRRVAVLGGSFIAMESAASLRSRGLRVDLISPEQHPMSKAFGRVLSDLIVDVHRKNGVALRLGRQVVRIDTGTVTLDDGAVIGADLVLMGVGVKPRIELAQAAGLRLDREVLVDAQLRTSVADIFAVGDIARWPDPHSGEAIRVEHWVVAERQGATAAANMLGAADRFEAIPFFWTKHFDLAIRYVGHAEKWDELLTDGSAADRDILVRYRKAGRDLAVATVGRDFASLEAEQTMMRSLVEERSAEKAR